MEQITSNVYVENGVRGCNHGFVTTSDGIVLIDTPQKPSDALRLKAEIERHGPIRYIINTEPHGDHWTGNAFFDVPVIAHAGVRTRILATDMKEHLTRVAGTGPEEGSHLDGYTVNAPIITFAEGMTLHVGDHTFRMTNMPGHTPFQAAVSVEEEGVVFTSDNIFCKVHTWIQEGNPDHWLDTLDMLRELPEESFVPGHGPLCDKAYLNEQEAWIREWLAYVKSAIERGMTKEDAVTALTDMTDRYPMDVEQDGMAPMVMKMNVANIWDFITGEGIHSKA
jgi:cyclase